MGDGWSSFFWDFGFDFGLDGGDGGEGRRTEKKKERGGVKRGDRGDRDFRRGKEVLLKKRR